MDVVNARRAVWPRTGSVIDWLDSLKILLKHDASMTTDPQKQNEDPQVIRRPSRASDRWLLIGGLIVVSALFFLTPGGLLDKADHIGYAVCHQIPIRSYFFGNHQLPLCARCSGQYLGALGGMLLLIAMGRGRSGRLPPTGIVVVLLGFLALWAFDGFNSYLTLIPGAPHLYEPQNILRVTTGAMQGVALIALVLPFFNSSPGQKRPTGLPSNAGVSWLCCSCLLRRLLPRSAAISTPCSTRWRYLASAAP